MKTTIDRIDDGIAVLIPRDDDTLQLRIPASLLPESCREGDIVTVTLERDESATAEARARTAGLIARLTRQ